MLAYYSGSFDHTEIRMGSVVLPVGVIHELRIWTENERGLPKKFSRAEDPYTLPPISV